MQCKIVAKVNNKDWSSSNRRAPKDSIKDMTGKQKENETGNECTKILWQKLLSNLGEQNNADITPFWDPQIAKPCKRNHDHGLQDWGSRKGRALFQHVGPWGPPWHHCAFIILGSATGSPAFTHGGMLYCSVGVSDVVPCRCVQRFKVAILRIYWVNICLELGAVAQEVPCGPVVLS